MFTRHDVIVLIGASYVRGWNLHDIAGARVINKGVDGEQSFEMLSRFEQDVIALRPRAVIIWGYINDIFRSETNNLEDKLNKAQNNLKQMVFKAREHNILPILATEISIRGQRGFMEAVAAFVGKLTGKASYQDYVNNHVRVVNQWIREFSKEHCVSLVDFEEALSDETGARKKDYAEADGSHISQKGYDKLSIHIKRHVEIFRVSMHQ